MCNELARLEKFNITHLKLNIFGKLSADALVAPNHIY